MTRYSFTTAIGTFDIVPNKNKWAIAFNGKLQKHCDDPQQAVDQLASGSVSLTGTSAVDTATLGLPTNISNWAAFSKQASGAAR